MLLPSLDQCEQLYREYAVPSVVQRHCRKVAEVGVFLAEQLNACGQSVNVELVRAGSLLHDAFKAVALPALTPKPEWNYIPTPDEIAGWERLRAMYPGKHETEVAADILGKTYPEFAVFLSNIGGVKEDGYRTGSLELKSIHYADWRVQIDQIVPFDERLNYLRDAYRHKWIERGEHYWEERLAQEKTLEAEIFRHLSFTPDELSEALVST